MIKRSDTIQPAFTIALAGNPNVGKSTVFNALTGMHQHTGNWPGKTVTHAEGYFTYKNHKFKLVDLPGAYSLMPASADEAVTGAFIRSGQADLTLIVADATCLERNLNLVLQILSVTKQAVLCINLLDEAEKKGILIDLSKLADLLGIPVVGTSARSKKGLDALREALLKGVLHTNTSPQQMDLQTTLDSKEVNLHAMQAEDICTVINQASLIAAQCVTFRDPETHRFDRRLDKIVTSRLLGFPIMLGLLGLIFWLTMVGANYPSQWLTQLFALTETHLRTFFSGTALPVPVVSALMDGVYTTLAWVISVMLPPMAIFFPLFTLLEDFGYLPRVAFNLDKAFRSCHAHGKQCLSMCMGFGCNACGVMGCRIIDSPRERLIAILTNNFVPCNGRFPTLISLILMFFAGAESAESGMFGGVIPALMLTGIILLGILVTLACSRLLSSTILKGLPSSFTLELPPYRIPRVGDVIVRSVLDRTLFVLGRAVCVAAPAGLIIWLFANIQVGDATLLAHCTQWLDPFAKILGLDGVILMAFILGFPANEIVMPIIIMAYMAQGHLMELNSLSQLHDLLAANGWTPVTAICVMLLCLMHFPCGTTCLTIKKETGSWKWTAIAFLLPTLLGLISCFIVHTLSLL